MSIVYFLLAMSSSMFVIFSCSSSAANNLPVWGKVNMQGAIIDAACSISLDTIDQTIDMGTDSISNLIKKNEGQNKILSIELINCLSQNPYKSEQDWKKIQITFDGDSDAGLFKVHGYSSGVALKITDPNGNNIYSGAPVSLQGDSHRNIKLKYTLKLVPNNDVFIPGEYFSVIRFRMDYF